LSYWPSFIALLHFLVGGVLPAPPTIFLPFEAVRRVLFVLGRRIISTLTISARQGDDLAHPCSARAVRSQPSAVKAMRPETGAPRPSSPVSRLQARLTPRSHSRCRPPPAAGYTTISLTTPAPTVLPPSRMAKRISFSRAMGWMSSTFRRALSPGITISTPSGRVVTPVTSVVRK